jgi:hypothetical protein
LVLNRPSQSILGERIDRYRRATISQQKLHKQ